ncbi:hypothetical protein ACIRVK_11970 [Streptomyces sp. NPDC101152]|uniref:hypothetical protein n=1 Tax=Streptomyces sp. NPDC101152 TaxID=3366116 RepID=UPI0037F75BC6
MGTTRCPLALVCRVHTEPDGDDHTIPYTLGFTVTAPGTVAVGEEFEIVLAPDPLTFNPRISSAVHDIALSFRVPGHARDVSHTLAGGEAAYTEPRGGSRLVLRVPGPLVPGTPFTLPTLRWTLCADGTGPVESGLAGGDFSDPAWSYRWSRERDAREGTVVGHVHPHRALSRTLPAT